MEDVKIYKTNDDSLFKQFFPYVKAASTSRMGYRGNQDVEYDERGNPRRGPKGREIKITPYNGVSVPLRGFLFLTLMPFVDMH